MQSIEGALDQAASELESASKDVGGENDGAITGAQDSSTEGNEGKGLVKEVPPELAAKEKELMQAFHEKTQKLAEEKRRMEQEGSAYKQDAQALYELSKQDWFKTAIEAEKARRQGRALEINPDTFEALKNDPKAFSEYLAKRDQAVADSLKSQFKSEFEKLGRSQQEILVSREKESVASKFGEEFTAAEKNGDLTPYLQEGLSYERAYKLYCQDNGKIAGKKSEAPPSADRKTGAIEKGGMSRVKGGPVVKAKNLSEALDRAFELAAKGVKDYRFERP